MSGFRSRALRHKALFAFLTTSTALVGTIPANAQVPPPSGTEQTQRRLFNIAAKPLPQAIAEFSTVTGLNVLYPADQQLSMTSPGLNGQFTIEDGLRRLLSGTGVTYRFTNANTITLEKVADAGAMTLDPVTIQGQSVSAGATAAALPPAYAGGQVATGGQVGMLGNRDIMDTPFATTNYTQKVIQDQQARSLADVVNNDPSVRNAWSSSSYADQYTIRGLPVNNDDVSYGGLYGILPRQRISTELAERVEVLHGPNALLSGMVPSGTLGGAINVVPKHADDKPLTQLTESYYSDGQFGTHVDVGRRFGPNNELGVRVNGLYRNGDTAVDNQSQELSMGVIGLDYRGEKVRLSLDAGQQRQDYDAGLGQIYLSSGVAVPAAPKADKGFNQSWGFAETKDTFGLLRAEYDLTKDLTAYAAIGGRSSDQQSVGSSATIVNDAGDFTYNKTSFPYYQDNLTGEAGMRAKVQTGEVSHSMNAVYSRFHQEGGYLAYYDNGSGTLTDTWTADPYLSNLYNPVTSGAPSNLYDKLNHPSKTSQLDLTSFALADTLGFMDDRVQLTLGARHQRVNSKSFAVGTGAKTADYDAQKITPAVGLVVKPLSNVSLYGNYIKGLSEGGSAPAGSANVGEILSPTVSKQYETGVKVDFGGFTTTLALFQITKTSAYTDPDTLIYQDGGRQRNRGIELGTFGEVVPGVRVLGGVTLMNAKMTETAGGVNQGNKAIGVPDVQANIGAEWDTPWVEGLTLTGRMIYTGSQYYDAANTQELPDWTRFDAGARYKFEAYGTPVTVRASVENVFGQDYWSGVGASYSYLVMGAPRTYMLSTTVDF